MRSYAAYGTVLKRGDGGVGAGAKATRTVGTGNSALRITAKEYGTDGNAISFSVVVSGNNTPLTIGVVGNAITINAATGAGGAATSTVNDIVAALYATPAAVALVDSDNTAGDGTGVIAAASSAALSGGSLGAEVFTTVDGVKSLTGPSFSMETIDATHHTSASNYREVLPSFLTGGEVSFDLLYDPGDSQHEGILTDFESRVLRNFQLVYPDAGNMTHSFAAYISGAEVTAPIDDALMLSVTLAITGPVTRAT